MTVPYSVKYFCDSPFVNLPDEFTPGELWADFFIYRVAINDLDKLADLMWSIGFSPDTDKRAIEGSFLKDNGERLFFRDGLVMGLLKDAYLPEFVTALADISHSVREGRTIRVARFVECISISEAGLRMDHYMSLIREQILRNCGAGNEYKKPMSGWAVVQSLEQHPGLKWHMSQDIMNVVHHIVTGLYQSMLDEGLIKKHSCANEYRVAGENQR